MALRAPRVTVTASRTLVYKAPDWASSADPMPVAVTNRDAATTVYLGGDDVTAATGYDLLPGESFTADAMLGDDLYAITAAGSVDLRVIKGRQN